MRGRHITTGITLVVLVVLLVIAGVYGVKALLAPLPGDEPSTTSATSCSATDVKKGQKIRTRQVQVSVFNAGNRSGLAAETLGRFRARGFRAGTVGNAPSGISVRRAQVWTTQHNDVAARLVARQLGGGARVKQVDTDLGPGVDVLVGNGFHRLAAHAKSFLVLKNPKSACLPSATST
jgi:hypothetical protein